VNVRRNLVLLIAFLLAQPFAGLGQEKQSQALAGPMNALILWNGSASREDSVDQESFATMTSSMGFEAQKVDPRHLLTTPFGEKTLLIVPQASARSLSGKQVALILAELRRGIRLVTDGVSPLSSALSIKHGGVARTGVVLDKSLPLNHLHWSDRPRVPWIAAPLDSSAHVLYADSSTGHALAVSALLDKGKYIFLAPLLDEISGKGYSRFPTLVHAMVRELGATPPFRRHGIDAYFDPGYRFTMPMESLAALWRTWGIRAVHAAAWYYNSTPPYDYKRLIDAAHKNGILVYAWLEWPHVGQGFWNQHPEWRQKNALLQDAKLDWLNLMDLQNPGCMNAALNDLSRQLQLDWDGIDIAEFTITGAGGEALEGPERPDYFTSFGTPMRAEFAKVGGFDPLELENPASEHFWKRDSAGLEKFYEYRQTVNNRLLRHVVEFIVDLKRTGNRDWELIHTIVDNSLHPEFNHLLGFDLNATLALAREYAITLNVEDPYMEWIAPPIRYRHLRETLVSLLPDRSSMIDINVVPVHPLSQYGFSSDQATGTELLQQIQAAAEQNGRVCIYCESSVFEQDWPLIPGAMATGATITQNGEVWDIKSRATVSLNVGVGDRTVFIDGKLWLGHGTDRILVPSGNHRLSIQPASKDQIPAKRSLRFIALSGELLGCRATESGMDIQYVSPSRCLLTLGYPTAKVFVDGIPRDLPVLKGAEGYLVLAPSGTHRLSISK